MQGGGRLPGASSQRPVDVWSGPARTVRDDLVAVEEPLEIRVGETPIAVTMRTPGDDRELAAGFCLTEGIVEEAEQIERIETCGDFEHDNVIVVTLESSAARQRSDFLQRARRDLLVSSSCGLCGKETLDQIEQKTRPFRGADPIIPVGRLTALPTRMRELQTEFSRTGGLHAAALFSADGQLLTLREDIGRHNAVDKVIGNRLLLGNSAGNPNTILLVSGRASFEIVQKAAIARIPIVAAVSAASSLAVDLAARLQMTLVGFLRGDRLNVYSGGQRVAAK